MPASRSRRHAAHPGRDRGFAELLAGPLAGAVLFGGLALTFELVAVAPPDAPRRWALFPAGALLTLLEVASVVIAMLIFAIGWHTPPDQQPGSVVLLAAAFLAVGLFDLLHMLSFQGMPAFVTPSGPEKAIFFWLAARLAAGAGLVAVVLRGPARPLGQAARAVLLSSVLLLVAGTSWLGLAHLDVLPRTFVAGQGLTPLKLGLEYGIALVYALVAALLVYRPRRTFFELGSLLVAVTVMLLSELCFTLYSDVSDLFNLLGHLYKALAYGFLYHAVFVAAVRAPYTALRDAELRLRQEQEALRDSEALFRQAVAQAGVGKGLVALDGRWLLVNPALCRITGYAEEELLGLTFQTITHPDDLDADLAQAQQLLAGEITSYEMEKRYIRKDGRAVWILLSGSLVRRPDGTPLHFIAQVQDIDARKQAEQALNASQRQLSLVLDGSDDGFWDWDVASGAVTFSERWATMLGYQPEEIEPHVRSWERLVHPDDMPAVQAALATHFAGQTDQYVTEHRVRTRDGGWRWILDRGRVVERAADGSPLRMAGTHTDITTRKLVEAELEGSRRFLQSALDALASHIAILDEQGVILTVNAAWRQFAARNGLRQKDYGIGVNYLQLCEAVEGEDREEARAVAAGLRELLDGRGAAFEQEYGSAGSQRERWFLLRATRFADGRGVRLVMAHEDISRRREAEAQVQAMNTQLAAQVTALQHRTEELDQLVELNGLLRACRTPSDAYAVLTSFARRLFPAGDGVLYLRRGPGLSLEGVVRWGERGDTPAIHYDDCWALRRGRPHLVETTERGVCCPHLGGERPASTLCLPILVHGDVQGLLSLGGVQPLGAAESQLAQAVANQFELTLANLQLQESLRAQAVRDPLTGLFNRRYLEETLAGMLARYARDGQPFALLVVDIDHFKPVNDSYGHEAGDAVLVAVSAALRDAVRGGDIACRYGGEEFVLALVDVDEATAAVRAEQLREAVGALELHYRGQALPPLTVSVGLTTMKRPGTTAAALIAEADAALYAAKRGGRNQVVVADAAPTISPRPSYSAH